MEDYEVHVAIQRLGEFVTACNTYIEMTAPWKLAKDPDRAATLDHVLYALAESLRIIAVLLLALLPAAARELLYQLNWTGTVSLASAAWGGLPERHRLGKPSPLFPRIEPQ